MSDIFDEVNADPTDDSWLDDLPRWICLEGMNKDELAAYDYGFEGAIVAIKEIISGKDYGQGVCNEPWETIRRTLISMRNAARSSGWESP